MTSLDDDEDTDDDLHQLADALEDGTEHIIDFNNDKDDEEKRLMIDLRIISESYELRILTESSGSHRPRTLQTL